MKVSVSLSESDIAFLDTYASEHEGTRSGALRQAVQLLRQRDLSNHYERAWREDDGAWDSASADGLADEAW